MSSVVDLAVAAAMEAVANRPLMLSPPGMDDLKQQLAAVQAELAEVAARGLPRFVRPRGGGRVHRVRDAVYTRCGWHWSSPPAAEPMTTCHAGELCLRCETL